MSRLIELARAQLDQDDPNASRRSCWIMRSAMEETIDRLLREKGLHLGPLASTRSKLSCLEVAYADEPEVANDAQYAWSRLSEACHQHAYQLSPTYAEVRHLLSLVAALTDVDDPTGPGRSS